MRTTLYQSHLVRAWNFLSKLVPVELKIDRKQLMEKSKNRSKLSDFGDLSFIEPLDLFIKSLQNRDNLHAFGRGYVKGMIVNFLKNRLQLVDLWKRHPEILEQEIKKPLIILGLPRTGTSFLFNVLSNDPTHRVISNWEGVVSQIPPVPPTDFLTDPRRKLGKFLLKIQNYLAPDLKNLHQFYLDGPEECTTFLLHSFNSMALESMFNVPEYSQQRGSIPYTAGYTYYKKVLQTLQWAYPKQRWLLKSPNHIEAFNDLINVFPDACIIQTHRTPIRSVVSYASLSFVFQSICHKKINSPYLGEHCLQLLSKTTNQYMKQRDQSPHIDIYDLQYEQLIANPYAEISRIYDYFKIPLSQRASENMLRYITTQKNKKSKHHYKAADLNLDPDQITLLFSDYINRYLSQPHDTDHPKLPMTP